MTILQREDVTMVDNEMDLSESLLRITRHLRRRSSVTDYNKRDCEDVSRLEGIRKRLDDQIRFIDNALYFLEEIIPNHGGLDHHELEHCEGSLCLARQLRDIIDLDYH